MSLIAHVHFDKRGLVPVVIQDFADGRVLMLAYMNRKSLVKSLKTGRTWFYSRSRKKLWMKGEESGRIQRIKRISIDCDGDALLIQVKQEGGASCHEGYRSCFFRTKKGRMLRISERRIFDPNKVYLK